MTVFIVKVEKGSYDDFGWFIKSICSSLEKAEIEKKELEDKIQSIKDGYMNLYGVSYDDDYKYLTNNNLFSPDYEAIVERLLTYQYDNIELTYNNIFIDEEPVV